MSIENQFDTPSYLRETFLKSVRTGNFRNK